MTCFWLDSCLRIIGADCQNSSSSWLCYFSAAFFPFHPSCWQAAFTGTLMTRVWWALSNKLAINHTSDSFHRWATCSSDASSWTPVRLSQLSPWSPQHGTHRSRGPALGQEFVPIFAVNCATLAGGSLLLTQLPNSRGSTNAPHLEEGSSCSRTIISDLSYSTESNPLFSPLRSARARRAKTTEEIFIFPDCSLHKLQVKWFWSPRCAPPPPLPFSFPLSPVKECNTKHPSTLGLLRTSLLPPSCHTQGQRHLAHGSTQTCKREHSTDRWMCARTHTRAH